MQAINAALIDTLAACGDVNRNVLVAANPLESALHARSTRRPRNCRNTCCRTRAPTTRSGSTRRSSPAAARKPSRSTAPPTCRASSRSASRCRRSTTSTCSRTTWASSPSSTRACWWATTSRIGGGMGATHGDRRDLSAPRPCHRLRHAAAGAGRGRGRGHRRSATIGNRAVRKRARLKYTIDDRGLDWFKSEVERRAGFPLGPARRVRVRAQRRPLRLGRRRGRPLARHPASRRGAGRIADGPGRRI
jgi:sulfite reductase (NADPH) hemoprotein beta-component